MVGQGIVLEMYKEGSKVPRVTLIAKARREGDKLDGGRLTESGVWRRAAPSVYLKLGLPSGTLVGDPSAMCSEVPSSELSHL